MKAWTIASAFVWLLRIVSLAALIAVAYTGLSLYQEATELARLAKSGATRLELTNTGVLPLKLDITANIKVGEHSAVIRRTLEIPPGKSAAIEVDYSEVLSQLPVEALLPAAVKPVNAKLEVLVKADLGGLLSIEVAREEELSVGPLLEHVEVSLEPVELINATHFKYALHVRLSAPLLAGREAKLRLKGGLETPWLTLPFDETGSADLEHVGVARIASGAAPVTVEVCVDGACSEVPLTVGG